MIYFFHGQQMNLIVIIVGLYCQLQGSRGDGMSFFISIQHEMF